MGDADYQQERADSRERYETVLRIVEYNSNNTQQPAMASRTSIIQIAKQAGIDATDAKRSIQAAIGNRDLLNWHGKLARTTPEALRAVIEEEAASDTPRRALIAKCNRLLREADDD